MLYTASLIVLCIYFFFQFISQICATEIIQAKLNKIPAKIKLQVFGWSVPTWITNAYRQIGVFAFGAALNTLTTDIAKYSIGRLRPHFFSVSFKVFAVYLTVFFFLVCFHLILCRFISRCCEFHVQIACDSVKIYVFCHRCIRCYTAFRVSDTKNKKCRRNDVYLCTIWYMINNIGRQCDFDKYRLPIDWDRAGFS